MPGQPRDSYDTVVRKLADLDRRMEIAERHRHPTGRNSPGGGSGAFTDYVYAYKTGIISGLSTSSAAQDIACDTEWAAGGTAVSWNSAARFTANVDGLYLCSAETEFIFNGVGGRRTLVLQRVSGTFPFNGYASDVLNDVSTSAGTLLHFSYPVVLAAGNQLDLKVAHSTGAAITLAGIYAGVALMAAL